MYSYTYGVCVSLVIRLMSRDHRDYNFYTAYCKTDGIIATSRVNLFLTDQCKSGYEGDRTLILLGRGIICNCIAS